MDRDYETFIEGEQINLCIPNKSAIEQDRWHSWFNNISEMQNTEHAIFPNSFLQTKSSF